MAGDEYVSIGGGSLKLKGVKGSKVEKHKKKKHKKPAEERREQKDDTGDDEGEHKRGKELAKSLEDEDAKMKKQEGPDIEAGATKTAAELRHEERRRKLLNERLKREGVKSHKERVEELNKYLSGLTEHHDMPRIGPG